MVTYNPFKKPIGQQLDVNDLNDLITNQVAEGFYVEYKSDFVRPDKIARSIASFANTYGGWYFIGIEANKPKGGVASSICGFDITQHQDPMNKALTPIRQNLSHMPLLYHQLIEIGQDRAVIAIYIPEGHDTPYITKDGVIYRRAADASDPILEADRHSIDMLVNRAGKEKEYFEEFCNDSREFSVEQEHITWINIYLQPQPRDIPFPNKLMSSDNIRQLINKSKQPLKIDLTDKLSFSCNIPFNSGYLSGETILLQQVQPGQLANNNFTIQLFPDGGCKIHISAKIIPLPLTRSSSRSVITWPQTQSKESLKILTQLFESDLDNLALLKFIDFGQVAVGLTWAVSFYLEWLQENFPQELGYIWVRTVAQNMWRVVPFIDSDHWAELVNDFGLPVVRTDKVSIPVAPYSYFIFDRNETVPLRNSTLVSLGNCFGLPTTEAMGMFFEDIFRLANQNQLTKKPI